MTDFIDNFKPGRNDILYGNQAPRETYVFSFIEHTYNQLTDQVKQQFEPLDPGDQFPEDFGSQCYTSLEQRGLYINSYNEPITSGDFRDLRFIRLAVPGNDRIADYHDALERTRFAVDRVGACTLRSLAKGDTRLLGATGQGQIPAQDVTAAYLHLAVRRACKFGIDYIAHAGQSVVHYVLDGIVMQDVMNKTTFGVMGGKQGLPITTSELRHMFRHWNTLEDRAMTGKILFYRDQTVVTAPWNEQPVLWTPYAAQLFQKALQARPHDDALRALSEEFTQHVNQGRHAQAIAAFTLARTA